MASIHTDVTRFYLSINGYTTQHLNLPEKIRAGNEIERRKGDEKGKREKHKKINTKYKKMDISAKNKEIETRRKEGKEIMKKRRGKNSKRGIQMKR